ncbi:unnamed protein product [Rotaria sp. Silwood2]|nr:unnamed protein product [Rotaria sp. Silwood2]CAF2651817.1 unnamed protein product [Rotaria sp. Silwood2]CAF2899935.1 unnamed protein product [Rotaria sp. Silwood2]CAF3062968.1 unnamed protein product [Rotaria sp. Silwood2]CAF3924459.1 unnamed protein product [Rotaria sp. Silwood2]
MVTITRFDDLSPELILCIFDYLSSFDRYNSFFNYDYRLHELVKKRTEFSRKELNADILRFSTLHSWYKLLSFDNDGMLCFIIPTKGQQPRYSFDPRVTDANGLHWWFISDVREYILNERVRAIVTRYPFRLNAFFYHHEYKSNNQSSSRRRFHGGNIILGLDERLHVQKWLSTNYPEHYNRIFNSSDSALNGIDDNLVPIFDNEWLKVTTAIQKSVVQIWNDLKELDDVNPFQIEFEE